MYIANADGSNVHRILTTPAGDRDEAPDWSPDGKYIVFHRAEWLRLRQHWALYVMNANGKELRKITPDSLEATNPDW
jgi:Tol biopolymer transport system component